MIGLGKCRNNVGVFYTFYDRIQIKTTLGRWLILPLIVYVKIILIENILTK